MKYIIWGTGPYCQEKIKYIQNRAEIVAYVERKRTMFHGKETILPEEIANYEYDKLIILSSHYLEIIQEVLHKWNVGAGKIIPGIVCKPYTSQELELMSNNTVIEVNQDGSLHYIYNNCLHIKIAEKEDWIQVRQLLCHEENSIWVKKLSTVPIGKRYGAERGGSICRYYIDRFLEKNASMIKGRVLEIGDRTYSQRYTDSITESYCLHFDHEFEKTGKDFYGDLRDGTGLQENFYDCIILTQVFNFVEDIRLTPQMLLNSLKPNGILLVTVSGITPICRLDRDRWGHFWGFTDAGILKMFEVEGAECQVETYGNYKVACAFLGGMSYKELDERDLEYIDEDFQVFIMAVVRKKVKGID